jgi:hypothetical protein
MLSIPSGLIIGLVIFITKVGIQHRLIIANLKSNWLLIIIKINLEKMIISIYCQKSYGNLFFQYMEEAQQ